MDTEKINFLWELGYNTIKELETESGILASGREELYGCIFGRDSTISALNFINAYGESGDQYFLEISKKILINLAKLQGKEVNLESGEEPGKCIHEFRINNHNHLTTKKVRPWFVYPDNAMRCYDSVDSTPLFLLAVYRFYKKTNDQEFILTILPAVISALKWMLDYGDSNDDGLIDYRLNHERIHGGLMVQNWTDSEGSLFHEDGSEVVYPVAPVEVQAYGYAALNAWGEFFNTQDLSFSILLKKKAEFLKRMFNEKFVLNRDPDKFILPSGIDGNGKPLLSARSNMGHILWAGDSILEAEFIPLLVRRLLAPDIFEPAAGIRTLSKNSLRYDFNSYHNGSIWPHDNFLIAEGMEKFGFKEEAAQVRAAVFQAIHFFKTPLELFTYDNENFVNYCSAFGQTACKKQAWSASGLLAALQPERIRVSSGAEILASAV